MMGTRARLLGGLGALLTVATAVVVFAPGLVADPVAEISAVLESRDPQRLLLALGVLVGLYAGWTAWRGSPDRGATEGPAAAFEGVGDPPETVTAADRARTGRSFDERVADAVAGDDRSLASVQGTLARTAAATYARAADCDADAATRAVETGAWTDDPTAAAFLAGEDGPNFSLWARLKEWLDPAAERRRRIDRTVAAVETAFETDPAERADESARSAGGESGSEPLDEESADETSATADGGASA